jgi:hypothetical protein
MRRKALFAALVCAAAGCAHGGSPAVQAAIKSTASTDSAFLLLCEGPPDSTKVSGVVGCVLRDQSVRLRWLR